MLEMMTLVAISQLWVLGGPGWYSKVFLVDNPEMKSKRGKGYNKDHALSASYNQLKAWHDDVCSFFDSHSLL